MNLQRRIIMFGLPVVLAAICKFTIASADKNSNEWQMYHVQPTKIVDFSIDFLLTGTAIIFGVLGYVHISGTARRPGTTDPITTNDLVICAGVQFCALILIFCSTMALSQIDYIHIYYNAYVTVWIPDLIGMFAFVWVIFKLT